MAGLGGSSGDGSRSGDLGDKRLTELARRGGATPLDECSEFSEAFLSRVGVAERDELRMELPGRGVLGERLTAGFRGPETSGLGDRGPLAGDEVEMDSCLSDRAISASAPSASRC